MQDPSKPRWKIIYIIFICLYSTLIPLKIAAISTQDWYKQEGFQEWKGSLFKVYSASEGDYKEDSYAELANYWCETSEINKKTKDNYAGCEMFTNLSGGGISFAVFSAVEIVFIGSFIAFTLSVIYCDKNFLCLRVLFSIFLTLCGILGFIVMAGTSMIRFNDDCDTDDDNSSQSSTCALVGPQLDLFNLVYVITISFVFWVFICATKCEKRILDERINGQSNIESNYRSQDRAQMQEIPMNVMSLPLNGDSRDQNSGAPDIIYE
ncbi:unnamed protein product [Blepharisma stoltei]|uniref:Uncharacterized protein n=1 Tax=Blepharisma stoltei TaxID=1481888 RepID=A0AAU9JUX9_9CILI|nr:unnamed protein product [Blepharisma stoltei]